MIWMRNEDTEVVHAMYGLSDMRWSLIEDERGNVIALVPKSQATDDVVVVAVLEAVPEMISLLKEVLVDQETLKEPIRNEALCEKVRRLLTEIDAI